VENPISPGEEVQRGTLLFTLLGKERNPISFPIFKGVGPVSGDSGKGKNALCFWVTTGKGCRSPPAKKGAAAIFSSREMGKGEDTANRP